MKRVFLALALGACGGASDVLPGVGIGDVRIGMRYSELSALLGEPDAALTVNRQSMLMYDDDALEVVLVSSSDTDVSDDAYVLGVSAMRGGSFAGPAPDVSRADIEAALGAPDFEAARIGFWARGISVVWQDDVARQVAVFGPFELGGAMPEMEPALGGSR